MVRSISQAFNLKVWWFYHSALDVALYIFLKIFFFCKLSSMSKPSCSWLLKIFSLSNFKIRARLKGPGAGNFCLIYTLCLWRFTYVIQTLILCVGVSKSCLHVWFNLFSNFFLWQQCYTAGSLKGEISGILNVQSLFPCSYKWLGTSKLPPWSLVLALHYKTTYLFVSRRCCSNSSYVNQTPFKRTGCPSFKLILLPR